MSIVKKILDIFFDIDSRRTLPKFAKKSLVSLFSDTSSNKYQKSVLLFPDTFLNYQNPEIGFAVKKILNKLGYNVIVPGDTKCCGRPMLSSGQIDKAKINIKHNIDNLYEYVKNGIEIIGIEPSCILGFQEDFIDLLDEKYQDKAEKIKSNIYIIDEFFTKNKIWEKIKFKKHKYEKIIVQPHCHQQSILGNSSLKLLLEKFGFNNCEYVENGCCGMAGSFGYEQEHYEVSLKVGEDRLLRVVREADPEVEIAAAGLSCRQQISHATGRQARHPAEILREAISGENLA